MNIARAGADRGIKPDVIARHSGQKLVGVRIYQVDRVWCGCEFGGDKDRGAGRKGPTPDF